MVSTAFSRAQRITRSVSPQHFWPVILLLVICFGCVFLLLSYSTRSQDKMQLDRERQGLVSSINVAQEMVQRDLQDYAMWDDAVRHTSAGIDRDWIADNIVAYLVGTQGYSYVFIVDGASETVFSHGDGPGKTTSAADLLGTDFVKSSTAVRQIPADLPHIISGFSRKGQDLFIYSTAAIVPLTQKLKPEPGPTKLLVIAKRLDDDFLAAIGREPQLRSLRLTPTAGSATAVPLNGVGRPVAWVEWTPHRPGTMLLRQLSPALAILAVLAVLTAIIVIRRSSRTMEALQQSELRARHHAFHDLLTGLPNRRALVEEISRCLAGNDHLSLLYMDLDGFKDANDVYGHPAGDLLLKEAASRIQAAVPTSLVARAGGDEFAVLLINDSVDEAAAACERILSRFRSPFEIGAYRITLGISIGCTQTAEGRSEGEDELMRRADVAMYAAKSEGKNRASHYTSSLDDGHILRMRLERDLHESVTKGEIYPCYQPIVSARSSKTVAFEALARWSHPEHGDVPPDIFIPIAEMTGLISAIGGRILAEACSTMKELDADLAVNLSPAQFWDRNLVSDVQRILADTGFPPSRLELEITESLLIRRPESAAAIVEKLRALGIKIALDDFGTGFASIGYLQRLKLDRIKIDKSFISPLEQEPKSRDMLLSIVTLAKAFDLEVCAEGVETEGQAQIAIAAGCTRLQGWLFGRPMSKQDALANGPRYEPGLQSRNIA